MSVCVYFIYDIGEERKEEEWERRTRKETEGVKNK